MQSTGYGLAVLAAVLWDLTYCLDERVLSSLSVFRLDFLHCLCGVLVAGLILLGQGVSPAILFSIDTAAQLCAAFFDRPGYPAARCTFRPAFTDVFDAGASSGTARDRCQSESRPSSARR